MPSKNDLYECYLAIVPGTVLSTLYRNYGTRLLESNVRAFLQQTGKVNKGIRDTIRNEPHMFLPYNNGLATTAQEVKTSNNKNGQLVITAVKDFQIVNGGQTTASLFHTSKKFKDSDLNQVFVQMKLTVIKDEDKKNETVPFISRYANSQNKVSELDLTSNNALLVRFEELSRTTYAIDPEDHNKQTIWFFERVKGQYREALNKEPTPAKQRAFKAKYPTAQKIIKSEIAKYMNIYFRLPYYVSRGAQKNYNFYLREAEKQYKKKKPNRVVWEDIVANGILFKSADKLFGRKNQNPIGDTNIKSHTVGYALALLHEKTDSKLNLGRIWETQRVEEELEKEIKKGLLFVYDFFNSLDVMLISEAAKSEKTWKKLLEQNSNPFDMTVLEQFYISESEAKERYDEQEDNSEETEKYNDLKRITDLGFKFWDGLNIYIAKTDLFSIPKKNAAASIRKKLASSSALSKFEISKGCEIIDILIENKTDLGEISKLSKKPDIEIADPSSLYNRFTKISNDDWKRIIDLGSQTVTLNLNEISVIKTVRQKLKRKETIDLKRLQIINESIEKLKKFGLKF